MTPEEAWKATNCKNEYLSVNTKPEKKNANLVPAEFGSPISFVLLERIFVRRYFYSCGFFRMM